MKSRKSTTAFVLSSNPFSRKTPCSQGPTWFDLTPIIPELPICCPCITSQVFRLFPSKFWILQPQPNEMSFRNSHLISECSPGVKNAEVVEKLDVPLSELNRIGILPRCPLHKGQCLDLLCTQSRSFVGRGIDPVADNMTAVKTESGALVREIEEKRPQRPLVWIGRPKFLEVNIYR